MPFAADIRHWPTVAAFEAYLAEIDPARAAWVKGLTLHHTYIPTLEQWHGQGSVEGLRDYYRDQAPWTDAQGHARKGWSAGPHLFIGPDGIWQLTPVTVQGIHAVSFNHSHWGLEVVGYYDKIGWPQPTRGFVFGAAAALLRWRGLPASAVNGHRDDPKTTKTCPGTAIDLNQVRAELAAMLAPAKPTFAPAPVAPRHRYTADSPILGTPRASTANCTNWLSDRLRGTYTSVEADLIVNAYFRLHASSGIDPVLALAQMAHETGNLNSWWAARPRRNPAGLGVTGRTELRKPATGAWAWNPQTNRWHEGLSFASWEEHAIPAHVGRLLAYAFGVNEGTPAQTALILWALTLRTLPMSYRGAAKTLRGLNGRWAVPGTDYADKIATIANAMAGIP